MLVQCTCHKCSIWWDADGTQYSLLQAHGLLDPSLASV
jgi:hypothetical protein